MTRPDRSEYQPYYAAYIDAVPDGDILEILRGGIDRTAAPLVGRPPSFGDLRYAPGKWTVREALAHLVDSERTFGFRAFWFARGGAGELPSFDQGPFVARAGAGLRPVESWIDEWRLVRAANLAFFETIDDETSVRTGVASGNRFTVRTFPWLIAGHEIHHRRLFEEKYLEGVN